MGEVNVARLVKNIRLRKGLTQAQLGRLAELGHNTVGMIERGDTSPSVSTLQSLALALDVNLVELVTEHEPASGKWRSLPVYTWKSWGGEPEGKLSVVSASVPLEELALYRVSCIDCYPQIQPNDLVLLDVESQAKSGNFVLYRLNKELMIRRLQRVQSKYLLTAINPLLPPIPADDADIQAVVVRIFERDLSGGELAKSEICQCANITPEVLSHLAKRSTE